MRLADYKNKEAELAISIDEDTLNIVYKSSKLTPVLQDDFFEHVNGNRSGFASADFIADVVTEWDLEGDDGQPFPLKKDALESLPVLLLDKITVSIFEDMNPEKKRSKTSRGGSLQKG